MTNNSPKGTFANIKKLLTKCTSFLNRKRSVGYVCALLSLYTLLAFHYPFFSYVSENINHNFGGIWLMCSVAIIMLALNYFFYYLLLYSGRVVGKWIVAVTMVCNSLCLYFMNTFNALIDRSMMANVFNSQFSESSSFLSWGMACYALLLGIVPSILLLRKSVNYGTALLFLRKIAIALAVIVVVLASNYKNVFWIDQQAPIIGSKILPWSYVINTIRHFNHQKKSNQKEIILPDVEKVSESKDICVLILGESARSQNFSLYGYERATNPLMTADGVTAIRARASHTNTIDAVKAILQHKPGKLHEILPNYLSRNGVDVIWRRSNWGTPPLHVEKEYNKSQLKKLYPEADDRYDGILFHGLKEQILASDKDKIFIGIHTYTSHGPEYYSNTPESLKVFSPESKSVDMSNVNHQELINAYDNTIIYTDYLVHSVIETLKEFSDRRTCVIFISDHGESLGEGGLYMHGVPLSMAPAEQLDIPFIVWTSDNSKIKDIELAGHYNIYHSVLKFLGLQTPFYDETKSIFE